MTEDKKSEMNGPPNHSNANHREENTRGGRRPHRFGPRGPPRNHDRHQDDQNHADTDHPMEENDMTNRRRRPLGRGGKSGGFGPKEREDGGGRNRHEDRVNDKLLTMCGSTYDLPQKDNSEQKFSSRCRLYIGNLAEVTEDEVKEMFKQYGEVNECFVNTEKMFAFVRLDYRANAERAKRELDGTMRKNRSLKVRFAPVGAAIKVKNLTQWVTNELLEYAFSVFGDIERAQVLVDERGNSLKEGIVEFARKPFALLALKRCSEGCFFLTSSLRPVVVEPYDVIDDVDGYPEKSITRKPNDYMKSREVGPRFASERSFEFEYGTRWKQLYEMYKQKEESLKRELKLEEEKLEAQMEYAKFEHETEMLREQLKQREMDRDRQKIEWEMKERQADEQRRIDDEIQRQNVHDISVRMQHQEEDLRRRQKDNSLFMQAQMDVERRGPNSSFRDGNVSGEQNVRNNRFEGVNEEQMPHRPPHPFRRGGARWGPGRPHQEGEFVPHAKRRRY